MYMKQVLPHVYRLCQYRFYFKSPTKGLSETSMAIRALSEGEINKNVDHCDLLPPSSVRGDKQVTDGETQAKQQTSEERL